MSKLTKLALEQHNTRLAAENEQLRAQVTSLALDLEIAQRSAGPQRPQWQIDRAAKMAAAKREAMAGNCMVLI